MVPAPPEAAGNGPANSCTTARALRIGSAHAGTGSGTGACRRRLSATSCAV